MEHLYKSKKELSRGRIRCLVILGILIFFIGLLSLILTVIDLFKGKSSIYNYNESEGGLKIENPLWSSSGKGFWVGLILITTGHAGILSSREGTRTSILAFAALAIVSTVLSFYMMFTCTISVQNYMKSSVSPKLHWQSNELILNSILMVVGALGCIVGMISSIFGCIYTNYCVDQRDSYLINNNSNQTMLRTSSSIRYPSVNLSRMSYPYQQNKFRISS